jgi:rhodanese-related sulfurtransferase
MSTRVGYALGFFMAGLWTLAAAQTESLRTPADLVAEAKTHIQEVTVDEVPGLLGKNALLIDVREPEEFAASRIPGSINIPRGLLEFRILNQEALKQNPDAADQPILLYCAGGSRGALAAQSLQALGFKNVYSLEGGLSSWTAAGQPVDTAPAP